MSERVTVATDAGEMPAYLWLPESGTGPGLLLLQEIFGVSSYIQRRGADLAAAGYVVLAPELYWRLDTMRVDESAPTAIDDAMALAGQLDWATAVGDAVAALEHVARGQR
jgi:carboxymethylenebutenolidase